MHRIIISLLVYIGTTSAIYGQSFLEYKGLLDKNQEQAVLFLKSYGFEVVESDESDGCVVYKFNKNETVFSYTFCEDEDGIWVYYALIERDLKTIMELLAAAKADSSVFPETATIASSSAFIFIEEERKEMFFMLDHNIGLYSLSGSNTAQFEVMKEQVESNLNFDPEKDMISLIRRQFAIENEKGETLQDALDDFKLNAEFNLQDIASASLFLKNFKNTQASDQFKEIIDANFLNDEVYIQKLKKSLLQIDRAVGSREEFIENLDEILLKIAIENNQIESLLMLDYLFENAKNVIATSSTTSLCSNGVFSSKKLMRLDSESQNKIVSNDTLYSNGDVLLTKSSFVCTNGTIKSMKVLRNLKDATVVLVPGFSELLNDSVLYINSHFFISPTEGGLIVSTQVDGNDSWYTYPEDEALYSLTSTLNKEGLYRLEKGNFVFVTEKLSEDAFKEYCSNETCYIPFPALLYDKKIDLNALKSVNDLEYSGQ